MRHSRGLHVVASRQCPKSSCLFSNVLEEAAMAGALTKLAFMIAVGVVYGCEAVKKDMQIS